MIPWIQVYSNLVSHRKTGRLSDALGLANSFVSADVVTVGILVSLWTWAIQNAPDGDISACSARTVADACRWKKKPEMLLNALRETGWIDPNGKLHDWEEYALLLIEQEEDRKAKTRERVQRYREKKKQGSADAQSTTCNVTDNATVSECNAPTIPNLTLPNQENLNSFSLSGEREGENAKKSGDPFTAEFYQRQLAMAKRVGWSNTTVQNIVESARARGYHVDPETFEVTDGNKAK